MNDQIRVSQFTQYGAPGVLAVATVDKPSPGPGEVLVRVHGSSVNPLDTAIRRGQLRLLTGFGFPKGIGVDFSGEVEAVGELPAPTESTPEALGPDTPVLAPGDRVWGFLPGLPRGPIGAAAEFVVVRAGILSRAPASIDLLDAAALPLVGSTALVALREHGHLREGHRLLVRGASGGVGTVAIQLAKSMGAHVTAMAGASDLDFVREIGADDALDHRTHGAAQVGSYDVILDVVGTRLAAYRRHLSSHGRMMTTAARGAGYVLGSAIYGPRRIRAVATVPKRSVLADLADLVDADAIKPIIDTVVPLADVAVAHAQLEGGRRRGKHVVDVRG